MSPDTSAVAPSYLLDTGIVLGFQKSGHLSALTDAGNAVSLVLVEEVYDEITDPRGSKHADAAAKARKLIDSSRVRVSSIQLGSPESKALGEIRKLKTSAADLGEAASIALALHDERYVFVTQDAAASLRSLQELRGRTMSFHPLLRAFVETGAVPLARAREIVTKVEGVWDWRVMRPTWWDGWASAAVTSSPA